MRLSEKFALVMFNGRKQNDPELVDSIYSAGLLAAILQDMLDAELVMLQSQAIVLGSSHAIPEGAQSNILSQMRACEEVLSIDEWLKQFVFSVDSICMKVILAQTERLMAQKEYLVLRKKKTLFGSKFVYSASDANLQQIAQDIICLENYEDFLLGLLLCKCGLLEKIVSGKDCNALKQSILADERMENVFVNSINSTLSSMLFTLSTAGIMM